MRALLAGLLLVTLAAARVSADTTSIAPVYPGAVPGDRPSGVGLKAPPPQVKAYATADPFGTVKAWYRTHLQGAFEVAQPGMEQTEDSFLVGRGPSATVIMIQSFNGKTWILIGPPVP